MYKLESKLGSPLQFAHMEKKYLRTRMQGGRDSRNVLQVFAAFVPSFHLLQVEDA